MRKINKNYASPPAPLISAAASTALIAIVTAKRYSGSTYKARAVITALNRLYHHKCAYCEAHITAVSYQHVEHYRPKNEVASADLSGIVHHGYYWLGIEWSNLLISCTWCNGNGRKGVRFPLINPASRVIDPPALMPSPPGTYNIAANHIGHRHLRSERPLIINPETTHPSVHLKIEKTGRLKEKNSSLKGRKTIEILDLNRDGLLVKRKEIIDRTIDQINKTIKAHKRATHPLNPAQFRFQLEDLFDEIAQGTKPKKEYTMVYREILKNFDTLILTSSKIEAVFRPQVKAAFDAYTS